LIGERPDFSLPTADGHIGLEVTEYFRPHVPNPSLSADRPLQEQDGLKDRILARAQQIFESKHSERLRVQVLWRPRQVIDKKDVEAISIALASVAASLSVTADEHRRFTSTQDLQFPDPVTTIFARRIGPEFCSPWEVVAAGSVCPLAPDDLLSIIRDKERKLKGYRAGLAAIWLLIVMDWRTRASYAEFTDVAREHVYETAFDRVFVLDVFRNTSTSLRVQSGRGDSAA
jgi:hypothetical protein